MKIAELDTMSRAQERIFWTVFEWALANDDGAAAKEHLAAGRPIYYCDDKYPTEMVRKWPDGRRELVQVDETGEATVLAPL